MQQKFWMILMQLHCRNVGQTSLGTQAIESIKVMPGILPTTPNQNLNDLQNTINWFANQWSKFTNTKIGRKVDRFFNGPTEEDYNNIGFNKPKTDIGIAGLVVPKFGLPLKARQYATNTSNWNTKWMDEDLAKGKKLAQNFLTSSTRNATFSKNSKEFYDLYGMTLPRNDDKIFAKVSPRFTSIKATTAGVYNPNTDEIIINSSLLSDYDRTLFHELLHRSRYGQGKDPKFFTAFPESTQILADKFYENKARSILTNNLPAKKYEYILDPGEAATNLLEIGTFNGLKWGEQFPGKDLAISRISKIYNEDERARTILDRVDWKNKPELVWKALTGTLFGSASLIVLQQENSDNHGESVQ